MSSTNNKNTKKSPDLSINDLITAVPWYQNKNFKFKLKLKYWMFLTWAISPYNYTVCTVSSSDPWCSTGFPNTRTAEVVLVTQIEVSTCCLHPFHLTTSLWLLWFYYASKRRSSMTQHDHMDMFVQVTALFFLWLKFLIFLTYTMIVTHFNCLNIPSEEHAYSIVYIYDKSILINYISEDRSRKLLLSCIPIILSRFEQLRIKLEQLSELLPLFLFLVPFMQNNRPTLVSTHLTRSV